MLALPKSGKPYSHDTDASAHQVGCALFQEQEDRYRSPIRFWSRTLSPAERNYSASERECLPLVYGITTCRPYLFGEHFTVDTDHAALRLLMSISDPSGRLMRWRLRLAEYTFDVRYKEGNLNCTADAVSRIPSTGLSAVHEDPDPPCLTGDETHPAGERNLSEIDLESEVGESVPEVEDEDPKAGPD